MKFPSLCSTLIVNATSSAALGFALLIAPTLIGGVMGEVPDWLCRVVGVGLLVFAADVLWVALRLPESRRFVSWILAADIAWVGATPLVMLTFADQLSVWGHLLIMDVGLLVAGFAFLEWYWTRGNAPKTGNSRSSSSVI